MKKAAARAVLLAALPVLVGAATDPDPFSDRGAVRAWFRGAAVLGGAAMLGWAARTAVGGDDASSPAGD